MTRGRFTPARARKTWTLLLVLARVLTLLFSLQLGGLVHDVGDVVAAVADVQRDEERCPLDGPCDDCPAGCPNCHCPNALGALAPAAAPLTHVDRTACVSAAPLLDAGRAPQGPDLPSIYRPPRVPAHS